MTGLFIFGLLCLVVALSPKFWELVHWAPKPVEDKEAGDSIVSRRAIRLVLVLLGASLVAGNFPGVPENLAYPGWFFFGVIALFVALSKQWTEVYPFSDEDFRNQSGTQEVIAWFRVIALVIGAFSVGVGMQTPDEPKTVQTPAVVEQAVEQIPEQVPAEEITTDSSS